MLFSQTQLQHNPLELEPLISIQLFGHKPAYQPGAVLRCDYQLDAVDSRDLQAIEASVLWYTEGKGDEDLGVHYFERRSPADCSELDEYGRGDLRQLRSFVVELPNSPLSYEGEILQIRWCVRLRVFAANGREYTAEHDFQLANLSGDFPLDRGRIAPGVLGEGVLGEGVLEECDSSTLVSRPPRTTRATAGKAS